MMDGLRTTFWYDKPAHLPFTSTIAIWAELLNIFQSGSVKIHIYFSVRYKVTGAAGC